MVHTVYSTQTIGVLEKWDYESMETNLLLVDIFTET